MCYLSSCGVPLSPEGSWTAVRGIELRAGEWREELLQHTVWIQPVQRAPSLRSAGTVNEDSNNRQQTNAGSFYTAVFSGGQR